MDDSISEAAIAPLTPMAVGRALGWFWFVFVGLNTLRSAVLAFANPLGALERRLVVASVGAALAWAMYRLLDRFRMSSLRTGILLTVAMSLPAALIFSTVNFLAFSLLTPMPGETCHAGLPCTLHDLVVEVSDMLINWAFVFGAWGLLYLSLASAAQTRAADLRSGAHRETARLAQIRALRYQVNPHFLFNVLNSLTALVSRGDTAEAEALIGEIGSFLRYGLATDPVADTTLGDEVEMQKRYLELERRRFPTRLSIRIDIAAGIANAAVPPLICSRSSRMRSSTASAGPARRLPFPSGRRRLATGASTSSSKTMPPIRPPRRGLSRCPCPMVWASGCRMCASDLPRDTVRP